MSPARAGHGRLHWPARRRLFRAEGAHRRLSHWATSAVLLIALVSAGLNLWLGPA